MVPGLVVWFWHVSALKIRHDQQSASFNNIKTLWQQANERHIFRVPLFTTVQLWGALVHEIPSVVDRSSAKALMEIDLRGDSRFRKHDRDSELFETDLITGMTVESQREAFDLLDQGLRVPDAIQIAMFLQGIRDDKASKEGTAELYRFVCEYQTIGEVAAAMARSLGVPCKPTLVGALAPVQVAEACLRLS